MNFRKKAAPCNESRQVNIVSHRSSLGYGLAKIRACNYWNFSPLYQKKTPSFKVNSKLNKWYDLGFRKGGAHIDFAILYNDCTVDEFLKTLNDSFSFHRPVKAIINSVFKRSDNAIIIVNQKPLAYFVLQLDLYERSKPINLVKQFSKEVIYCIKCKEHLADGSKNNSGIYELRNVFIKAAVHQRKQLPLTVMQKKLHASKASFSWQ